MESISTDAKVVFGIIFFALIFGGGVSANTPSTSTTTATTRTHYTAPANDAAVELYRQTHRQELQTTQTTQRSQYYAYDHDSIYAAYDTEDTKDYDNTAYYGY